MKIRHRMVTTGRCGVTARSRSQHLAQVALIAGTTVALVASAVVAGHAPTAAAASDFPSLQASYNNVGVTADDNTAPGDYDGYGSTFSETALTNAGAGPGATVTSSGMTFEFPSVSAGTNDNTVAEGQTIDTSGSGTLGFLLSSDYGGTSGTGTLTYTDGSTQSYILTSPDWVSGTPLPNGVALAVSSAYQNRPGNTAYTINCDIYSETVTLTPGKTLASVTLPPGGAVQLGVPALHIFALSSTPSSSTGNTVTVTGPGNRTSMAGKAASLQIQASDSGSGQNLTYTASGLPAGLSINSSSGLISGTPTTAGTYTVTVTATDSTGATGSVTFAWTITPGSCKVAFKEITALNYIFAASADIYNTGTSPIQGWSLQFTFRGNEQVDTIERSPLVYDRDFQQAGERVTIPNNSYDATINPGHSTIVDLSGYTSAGKFGAPLTFTLNGISCAT